MNRVLYDCKTAGEISRINKHVYSQFCTAKKYSILYKNERSEYKKRYPKFYAWPYSKNPIKVYNGIGRSGIPLTSAPKKLLGKKQKEFYKHIFKTALSERKDWETPPAFQLTEQTTKAYLKLYSRSRDYEILWLRQNGSDEPIPQGYHFIGHDVTFVPDESGAFSMISDCLFIPKWHGCDKSGTLFTDDFSKLNDNGLFDDWHDAYDYMMKYLNEGWAETGIYGIFEIYKR